MTEHQVTFRAACGRFARKHKHYRRICKLRPAEAIALRATYALVESNHCFDYGELDREDWCREAGVLGHNEAICADAA
ncbi:hypothetical protein ACVWXN_005225 [Bradyrhizobium sp. i1.4.4]